MPYTLLKFLVWAIAFFAIGVLVGWLLRSLKSRAEVSAARQSTIGDDDVDRMRHRLANLEPLVAERDELRARLDAVTPDSEPESEIGAAAEPETEISAEADADSDAEPEPDVEPDAEPEPEPEPDVETEAPPEALDMTAASAVLGGKVRLDDLTMVEGIGPKISELCNGIGVTTWRALADTDAETLRSMLDAAGSRYKVHDPTTWASQAGLLADGRWADFKQFTDDLRGGR